MNEISGNYQKAFVESFPGFLSIRDEKFRFIYLNNNFRNWLKDFTDVEPVGKTSIDIAQLSPVNVSEMLHDCHDGSLKLAKTGEAIPKMIRFVGLEGAQFFEIVKFKQVVDGQMCIFTTGIDVTNLHESARMHEQRSLTCDLTGLKNRRALMERIECGCNSKSGYLVLLDLDNYKWINDTFGHEIGDKVLIQFGQLLHDVFPKRDFISRVGGDEFVILIDDKITPVEINTRLNHLKLSFYKLFKERYPRLGFSAGYSEYEADMKLALNKADRSMYKEKSNKRHHVA